MADAVPVEFVTRTSTWPGAMVAGDVAVIDVAELTTTPVAAVDPNVTVELTVKKVPVMVTDVPPPDGPEVVSELRARGCAFHHVRTLARSPSPLIEGAMLLRERWAAAVG